MKTFNIKFGGILLIAATMCISCQDVVTYNDGYDDGMTSTGVPAIENIYDLNNQYSPIEEGSLKQMIVLKGENLSGVTKIMLNDIEVPLNEVYATAKAAYFPIPRKLPQEVNNTLYYETELGNTSRAFSVTIPSLKVEGLYNEFALPGDTVQVMGDFFDLYGFGTDAAVISMNEQTLEIDSISENYLSIIIPEDAADNSIIEFSYNAVGGTHTSAEIPYRHTQDVFWDLSDPTSCGLWAGKEYITDGLGISDPKPLYGSYIRVAKSLKAWSWNNLPCGGFNLPAEIAANPADYYLKFEVNSASKAPFYDSGEHGYLISMIDGINYAWNPSKDISFNTYGNWRTITLELTDIIENDKGKELKEGWVGFALILQPNSDWNVDHSFANYRIQKK